MEILTMVRNVCVRCRVKEVDPSRDRPILCMVEKKRGKKVGESVRRLGRASELMAKFPWAPLNFWFFLYTLTGETPARIFVESDYNHNYGLDHA